MMKTLVGEDCEMKSTEEMTALSKASEAEGKAAALKCSGACGLPNTGDKAAD